MLNVQIVLFDGFDLLDAVAPYEVFAAAALMTEDALSVEFVAPEGPRPVTSGINGVRLEAMSALNPDRGGIILVPGASGSVDGDGPDTIPAILGRAAGSELTGMIRQALGRPDVTVATVCGGSLVLAMGGLLEGRPAVTNHLGMDLLGATGAVPVAARVVDDGNLVTAGGVTSGLDIALYLVERELGPRIAHAVEQLFEFERRGTVWRGHGMAPSAAKSPAGDEPDGAAAKTDRTSEVPADNRMQSSVFEGDWEITIATPVGKLPVRLSITTQDGIVRGTASQGDETVPLVDPVLQDRKLTWSLPVTKPLRLNLKFEAEADGDRIGGTAKAGILPASKWSGNRVS
ncbi:DJ-1/PfpI family protein [Cohnella sp. REN36]|uniref:DJ-1/PfpI family protein n=1 Tax=Cohnella sp. REN36 TaxID=2887347 RepID=UPI001D15BDCC|nr:DJ-1/PfpI family protein [Cohnella sp. REN36]MCC3371448.1 DJ-1/PfpI family protein [Cohnella sp. REN36]